MQEQVQEQVLEQVRVQAPEQVRVQALVLELELERARALEQVRERVQVRRLSTGAEAGPGNGPQLLRDAMGVALSDRGRSTSRRTMPATPAFPHKEVVNPYYQDRFLQWTTDDWDPALRFWTLPYDLQLNHWLKSVDPSRTYIMAGREFGAQDEYWQFDRVNLLANNWLEPLDLAWQPDPRSENGRRAWRTLKISCVDQNSRRDRRAAAAHAGRSRPLSRGNRRSGRRRARVFRRIYWCEQSALSMDASS